MSDVCPGCGAKWDHDGEAAWTKYTCGAVYEQGKPWIVTHDCLTRQLAQANAHLAAIRPVVRAAMEQTKAYDGWTDDVNLGCEWERATEQVEHSIRSLPDSELAWWSGEGV